MPSIEISSLPGESDALELDHQAFPYAGKFGRRRTGTVLYRDEESIIGAISFSPDRSDDRCCRIRYLAIHRDHQQQHHAQAFASTFVEWAQTAGYDAVKITVINPYAVTALCRGTFGFTGETGPTGGVVLEAPRGSTGLADAMAAIDSDRLDDGQRRYVRRYRED